MQPFIGEIRVFGGSFNPVNWAFCNGQLLSISEYQTLYALIGTTYGGDGISTFALPNLNGRMAIDQGQGTGLTNRVLGSTAGVQQVTLLQANMPAHAHGVAASTATATSVTHPTSSTILGPVTTSPSGTTEMYIPGATPGIQNSPLDARTIGTTGGNIPHENMMTSIGLTFIIALFGIFPSRN